MLARGDDPPEPPERHATLLTALRAVSPETAVLARGDDPPEPPERHATLLTALRAVSPETAVLARGDDPPDPHAMVLLLRGPSRMVSMTAGTSTTLVASGLSPTCPGERPITPLPRRSPCCGTWTIAAPRAAIRTPVTGRHPHPDAGRPVPRLLRVRPARRGQLRGRAGLPACGRSRVRAGAGTRRPAGGGGGPFRPRLAGCPARRHAIAGRARGPRCRGSPSCSWPQ